MAKDEKDRSDKPEKLTAYIADLADFQPDPDNLNLHTQRGQALVTQSQQKRGYGRPAFAANDGTVLGGNLSTMEVASDIGLGDGKVLVVETTGDIPIIHKRLDVKPGSVEAKLLAAEDNRSAEVSITWNPEQLLVDKKAGVDFSGIFTEEEQLNIIGSLEPNEAEKSDGSLLALVNVTIGEPRYTVEPGQVWRLGKHLLICCDVLTEWQKWVGFLDGEKVIFAPYPGPFVPLSLKAEEYVMVMVQPDPYIAGHIIDRYEEINGDKGIIRD